MSFRLAAELLLPTAMSLPTPSRLYLISHQEESLFESKADHSLYAFTGLHLSWSVEMQH